MTDVLVDRRVKRTRVMLREAVLQLAETQDLTEITVQDITRSADINRATFYQHYRDKDELIEQTIEWLLEELFEPCAPVLAGVERLRPDVVHPSTVAIFDQIGRRANLYRRLIGFGGSAYFIRRFQLRNEQLSLQAMSYLNGHEGGDRVPADVRARCGASAFLGLLSYWLETGQRETPETMAGWSWRLVRSVWFD